MDAYNEILFFYLGWKLKKKNEEEKNKIRLIKTAIKVIIKGR